MISSLGHVCLSLRFNLRNYRAFLLDSILGLFSYPLALAVYYFVWSAIAARDSSVSVREMVVYYSIALYIQSLYSERTISTHVEESVVSGDLMKYLCKPVTLFEDVLGKIGASAILRLPFSLPMLAVLAYFSHAIAPVQLLGFGIVMFLALVMNALFYFCLSLLAFRFERIWVLRMLVGAVISFLSGGILPLSMFPTRVERFISLLPFKYFVYTPTQYLLGPLEVPAFLGDVLTEVAWVVGFGVVCAWGWRRAMRIYMGYGV